MGRSMPVGHFSLWQDDEDQWGEPRVPNSTLTSHSRPTSGWLLGISLSAEGLEWRRSTALLRCILGYALATVIAFFAQFRVWCSILWLSHATSCHQLWLAQKLPWHWMASEEVLTSWCFPPMYLNSVLIYSSLCAVTIKMAQNYQNPMLDGGI